MTHTEWRVVEADGRPWPPHAAPLRSRDSALRRMAYYESVTRVTGEARLPLKPMRVEWRTVECGPWNGRDSGLDLVAPLDAGGRRDR